MKKTTKRTKFISLTAGLVVLGLGLTACGGSTEESTTAAPETTTAETTAAQTTTPAETTTAAPEFESIGKESKDAISFTLTNKTGQDIKSFIITSDLAAEEAENILDENDLFKQEETCIIYYTEEAEEEETTAADDAETAEEKELTVAYEMRLILEDDSEITLHAFPLEDIASGEVKTEEGLGYLVYENLKGEKDISTLKAEKAIAETAAPQEETTTELPAETAAEVVTEAATEAVYEEPVYEEPVYEEPVYEEPVYEEPVYEEPVYEAPADTADDACVEDGLLY